MTPTYCVAEGHDDYNAFSSLWPEKYGRFEGNPSAQQIIVNALRAGSAILARNSSDSTPLAATVLDFDSYREALFVPFILISDGISNRAAIQRRMLELILKAFDASRVHRLLFVTDDSKDHRAAVADFNEAGAKAGLPAALKIVGHAENLYGDGRKVMFNELFITSRERPDLTVGMTSVTASSTSGGPEPDSGQIAIAAARSISGAAGIGAQVLNNRLMSEACCSGCGEKDKEKEKEIGKDKDGAERLISSGKLNVENPGSFILFSQIGIHRFNPYASAKFGPLV
ncbi:MAG TPA: hypothetical protein VNV39_02125 [Stellaceae bacterium]|nr:hypothetical protein [Stellaceae bacterium]